MGLIAGGMLNLLETMCEQTNLNFIKITLPSLAILPVFVTGEEWHHVGVVYKWCRFNTGC